MCNFRVLTLFLVFLLVKNSVCSNYIDISNNAVIQEVKLGKNAILKCVSNLDSHYVFSFWQVQKHGVIIGPNSNYDKTKFDYDTITGNLTIRVTTLGDEGLYNCFSKNTNDGKNYTVSSVKLTVHKDWEEVYEEDANINLLRACVALAIILGMLIIIYIILRVKQSHRKVEYTHFDENDEEEDDSNEELFNRPSTSRKHHYTKNKQKHHKTPTVTTKSPDDFEKVYTTINMSEDV